MARRGRRPTTAATSSTRKGRPSARRAKGKLPGSNAELALPAGETTPSLAYRTRGTEPVAAPATQARAQFRYGELLQRAVSHYAPAAVLINPNFEILSMQGPLVDYLEFPPGEPTKNLLSLARPGLRARIAALVQRANQESAVVSDDAAQVRRNARLVRCLLTARPISEPREARGWLLIVFQDRPDGSGDALAPGHESPLLQQLEDELKATREELQRTLEECASVNGELAESNRRMQSKDAQLRQANDELQKSLAYRRAVEHLPVAAVLCYGDSQLYMNQAAEALTAYRQGELPTLQAWFGALFGDRERTVHALYQDLRRSGGHQALTVSLMRKDGMRRAVELSAGVANGMELIILRDVTEKRAMQRQVLDIASDEQRRVGQELHDVVLQDLTGLGLLADAARNNVPSAGPAYELVNKLVGGLRRLNVKVRALCEGLVPLEFEVGDLRLALQALAETTSRAHGLTISVEAEPLTGLDQQVTQQLYRIVQEALVNIVRYSQASLVVVRLSDQQAEGFRLEISDDGIGGDEARRRGGGSGARIMQYRCTLLGGQLQVLPRPEGGCIVSCTFARSLLTHEPDS
jgi:PAS domain S-box-containing protein